LLQILAEPNLLAINGKEASFLAGGEFPFPTIQGGGFGGSVTIQFREFGIRINFTPTVTPRGTIRLAVEPEVSTLDFANGITLEGFRIPALSTRRVQTEVELESGQSFAIGGLLDNRTTESLSRIPGIGDIPFFGRLFRSKQLTKNRAELLVLVTPEIVRPIPKDGARPDIPMPMEFLTGGVEQMPRTPGMEETGEVPVTPPHETLPVEQLREISNQQQTQPLVLEPIQRPWVLPVGPIPVPAAAPVAAPQGGGVNPGAAAPNNGGGS
jgi:pilus assembly protein CpaC